MNKSNFSFYDMGVINDWSIITFKSAALAFEP